MMPNQKTFPDYQLEAIQGDYEEQMPEAMSKKFQAGAMGLGLDLLDPVATIGRLLGRAGGMSDEDVEALEIALGSMNPFGPGEYTVPAKKLLTGAMMGTVIGGGARERSAMAKALKTLKDVTTSEAPARKTVMKNLREMFLGSRPRRLQDPRVRPAGTYQVWAGSDEAIQQIQAEKGLADELGQLAYKRGDLNSALRFEERARVLEGQVNRAERMMKQGRFPAKPGAPEGAMAHRPEIQLGGEFPSEDLSDEQLLSTAFHELGGHASDPSYISESMGRPRGPLYEALERSGLEASAVKRGKPREWIQDPREKYAYGLERTALGEEVFSPEAAETLYQQAGIDPDMLFGKLKP